MKHEKGANIFTKATLWDFATSSPTVACELMNVVANYDGDVKKVYAYDNDAYPEQYAEGMKQAGVASDFETLNDAAKVSWLQGNGWVDVGRSNGDTALFARGDFAVAWTVFGEYTPSVVYVVVPV